MTQADVRRADQSIEVSLGAVTIALDEQDARSLADAIHDVVEDAGVSADPPQPSSVPDEPADHPEGLAESDRSAPIGTPEVVEGADDDDDQGDDCPLAPVAAVYRSDSATGNQQLSAPRVRYEISGSFRRRAAALWRTAKFSAGVLRFMEARGIDPEGAARIVEDPDQRWATTNPTTGDAAQVVIRTDSDYGAVHHYEADGVPYVVLVRPVERLVADRRRLSSGKRSASKSSATARPAIENLTDLISRVEDAGLCFEQGRGHGKITDPEHPDRGMVTVPLTPSDSRAWLNTTAQIRRTLGVSL